MTFNFSAVRFDRPPKSGPSAALFDAYRSPVRSRRAKPFESNPRLQQYRQYQ
jgi:hypothetical protein